MTSAIVVGGGFKGIVSAGILSAAGVDVVLLEGGTSLGGVLTPLDWRGLKLDKGCHLFDNSDPDVTRLLLEILGDNWHPVDVQYASIMKETLIEGIAAVDLSGLPPEDHSKILYELVASVSIDTKDNLGNAEAAMQHRYGDTAARLLLPSVAKVFAADPVELEEESVSQSLFSRARLFPDRMCEILKSNPELDDRLACSSADDPMKYYRAAEEALAHRNFYPSKGSMSAFSERAHEWLEGLGVDIRLGSKISAVALGENATVSLDNGQEIAADKIIWSLDLGDLMEKAFADSALKQSTHPVPMVLYYFLVPPDRVAGLTYCHDFNPDHRLFRFSTQGQYGAQFDDDGNIPVCCEVTTNIGSDIWEDPESMASDIWNELLSLKLVDSKQPVDRFVTKTPVSYKLPKLGYRKETDRAALRIGAHSGNVVYFPDLAFSKVDIVKSVRRLL